MRNRPSSWQKKQKPSPMTEGERQVEGSELGKDGRKEEGERATAVTL